MNILRIGTGSGVKTKSPAWLGGRSGIAVFVALTGLLCTGSTAPTGCQPSSNPGTIGPSAGEVIGAAVGVGAAIAVVTVVAIEHGRHTLTGCVSTGPNGLLLRTSDAKIYAIQGLAEGIKPGDKIKFHGSRVKKTKDAGGNRVFVVEQVRKDYGPCPTEVAQASTPAPAH